MSENRISLTIAPADLQEIKDAIGVLQTKLAPLLLALDADERQTIPKMGDKTVAFVEKSYEHAVANPALVPQFLDVAEYKKDIDAVKLLRSLSNPLGQISQALDDTVMVAGSEAYTAALVFYNAAKGAAKAKAPGAEVIYNDLSPRFPGKPSTKATPVVPKTS